MSHAAYFDFDEPVTLGDWSAFCQEHAIEYSPNTVGQNVFYAGDIEVHFGGYDEQGSLEYNVSGSPKWETAKPPEKATHITVSTFWGGNIRGVAGLAASLWLWSHGQAKCSGDPDVVAIMLAGPETTY
jgi:hypothetical protein